MRNQMAGAAGRTRLSVCMVRRNARLTRGARAAAFRGQMQSNVDVWPIPSNPIGIRCKNREQTCVSHIGGVWRERWQWSVVSEKRSGQGAPDCKYKDENQRHEDGNANACHGIFSELVVLVRLDLKRA